VYQSRRYLEPVDRVSLAMGTLDHISLAGVLRSSSKDLPVANPVLWHANKRDNAFEYHWANW
jgi:hypothetical protein